MKDRPKFYSQEWETVAFPQPGVFKRAALLFDKICPPFIPLEMPKEILFMVSIEEKHRKQASVKIYKRIKKEFHPDSFYNLTRQQLVDILKDKEIQALAESYQCAGFQGIPVYDHQRQFLNDFPSGSQVAYQAALENLPDIIEDAASWEQILDFRNDKDALRKYRALRFWLHNSLHSRSVAEAKDVIFLNIEDYIWALHKHGFKTVTGALSSILSWKGLTAIIGGSGLAAVIGGPLWSVLTAGFLTSSQISVWLAEMMIEKKEIERGKGAEIALIYEAKKKFTKRKPPK